MKFKILGLFILLIIFNLNCSKNKMNIVEQAKTLGDKYCEAINNKQFQKLPGLYKKEISRIINYNDVSKIIESAEISNLHVIKLHKIDNGFQVIIDYNIGDKDFYGRKLVTLYVTNNCKIKYDPFYFLHPGTGVDFIIKNLESDNVKLSRHYARIYKNLLLPDFGYDFEKDDNKKVISKIKDWWNKNAVKYDKGKPFLPISFEDLKIVKAAVKKNSYNAIEISKDTNSTTIAQILKRDKKVKRKENDFTNKLRNYAYNMNFCDLVREFDNKYPNPLKALEKDFLIYVRSLPYVGEFKKSKKLCYQWLQQNPGDIFVTSTLFIIDRFSNYNYKKNHDRISKNEIDKLINQINVSSPEENAMYLYNIGQQEYFDALKQRNNPDKKLLSKALINFYHALSQDPFITLEPSGSVQIYNFIISTHYFLEQSEECNKIIELLLNEHEDFIIKNRINVTTSYYTGSVNNIINHSIRKYEDMDKSISYNKIDLEKCIYDLKMIIDNPKDYTFNSKSLKLQALYKLGYMYLRKRDLQKAVDSYNKILKVTENYAQIHNNLGLVYAQLGEKEKAIEHIEKAFKVNWRGENKRGRTLSMLIQMYIKMGAKNKIKYWTDNFNKFYKKIEPEMNANDKNQFERIKKELGL